MVAISAAVFAEKRPPTEAALVLGGLFVSRPEARPVWVLCRHETPKRASRNMPEPSFASIKASGSFYLLRHAICYLISHPS